MAALGQLADAFLPIRLFHNPRRVPKWKVSPIIKNSISFLSLLGKQKAC